MKIYGYSHQELPIDEIESLELAEITINASPNELRNIAKFLNSTADDMERLGNSYGHKHLSDVIPEFQNSPHFVVFNSEIGS